MKAKNLVEIAYRCYDCGTATVGLLGTLAESGDMLRLKCECGGSALEIKKEREGKLHLSVPCVYCKAQHSYVLASGIAARQELTRLPCPYSNMDIAFIGGEDVITPALEKSGEELARVIASFEGEELADIQPSDVDEGAEPPDPAVFDAINFLVRDLEDEGKISCPCENGKYSLRFTDDGIQVYCESCGASHTFYARTPSAAEEYLATDELKLR